MINIYYEIEGSSNVIVTYDSNGERFHDYFKSVYSFHTFVHHEHPNSKLIQITDFNYMDLAKKGLI